MNSFSHKKGASVVEALVGSAIILVALGAITLTFSFYLRTEVSNISDVQATLLAEEGIEAVRSMRDAGYSTSLATFSTSTALYLSFSTVTSKWSTTTLNSYVDGQFERKLNVSDVKRDGNDDIAASGTVDANTKLVTVTVSWRAQTGTTSRAISTYFTNLFSN